jgi:ribosomal protein S18 acetylase RimI-like enzyme
VTAPVVRPARSEDVPQVLVLWARARTAAASTPDTPEAVAALLVHAPGALLVAELPGGEIAGALIAGWDGWRGNLYRLAVDPPNRRQGIAFALVTDAERHLRAQGARRVTAPVANDDEPAAKLWEAAGYARDETIGRFVRTI